MRVCDKGLEMAIRKFVTFFFFVAIPKLVIKSREECLIPLWKRKREDYPVLNLHLIITLIILSYAANLTLLSRLWF